MSSVKTEIASLTFAMTTRKDMETDTSPAFVAKGYFGGVGRSEAGDVSVPFS